MQSYLKKILAILVLSSFFSVMGCRVTPLKINVPKPPIMRPVHVINGAISGQDLENLIDNHSDLWEYINRLRALLGGKNFIKLIKSNWFKNYLKQQDNLVNEVFNEYKKVNYPFL